MKPIAAPPGSAVAPTSTSATSGALGLTHDLGTFAAVVVVGVVAAVVAHAFRETVFAVGRALTGNDGSIAASEALGPAATFLLVAGGVGVAAWIGAASRRRHGRRVGLRAIAAAARDERPDPSAAGTAMRMGGTWVATSSLASLGRESAILEAGGTCGNLVGSAMRRPTHRLAVAGIASAFAVAYHAPVAAVLYVEEHLGVRHDRRTVAHAVAGSAIGFFVGQRLLGSGPIFPRAIDPLSRDAIVLAAVGVLPAFIASRVFVEVRERMEHGLHSTHHGWMRSLVLAAVAGAVVALVPMAAGNGMEAVRASATTATAGVAVALVLWKLIATSAVVGAGAPGGVMSPSLAVAAGAALATFLALDAAGWRLGGSRWDGMLVAMAIGVAVSIRSPLVAVVMVAEMTGDVRVLPMSAFVVAVAVLLDRAVERRLPAARRTAHERVHDDDA
ncbi:MAG: chloride channel protein [Actinomycetota bacterium]|nr:chloride channel protein [Actinomycetota bacterium]